MIEASGCIFLSITTGRILLQQRSSTVKHPNTWGFFGGKSEPGERPSETLYREIYEELGMLPNIQKLIPVNKFVSNNKNFEYNSFVAVVKNEFIPNINEESSGYAWVNVERCPEPLHPGAKTQLKCNEFKKKIDTIHKTFLNDANFSSSKNIA